jgi:hypothetical protein
MPGLPYRTSPAAGHGALTAGRGVCFNLNQLPLPQETTVLLPEQCKLIYSILAFILNYYNAAEKALLRQNSRKILSTRLGKHKRHPERKSAGVLSRPGEW